MRAPRKSVSSKAALLGRTRWAIAEGCIPSWSHTHGHPKEMTSHEALCILNPGRLRARILITVFFEDREPAGPYRVEVPARRTLHLRMNDLKDPEPIPRATNYSCLLESDRPVVVQHTRLDSRQSENALMTTIGYSQ